MLKSKTIFVLLVLSVALSACGRRTNLEAPSVTANPPAAGQPAPETTEDKPFVLDKLIQ